MTDNLPDLAVNGATVASGLTALVGPVVLFLIGVMAVPHLFGAARSMSALLQYAALAVGVVLVFYFPAVLTDVARTIAGVFGSGGGSPTSPAPGGGNGQ
ncbi:hypothetical protein B4N89_45135 [Embleya scabrispora]|uniref:Uncharacterized protein n=1 Tax=Embleya scabrispora TaxID=159449 RepID=A0A1T3NIG8_9ACTN|nr:hypothetical protein [Embleya scabrispora]OPC76676.1 hypothetical protein B4N89_45135 [Embleya scabrispora]